MAIGISVGHCTTQPNCLVKCQDQARFSSRVSIFGNVDGKFHITDIHFRVCAVIGRCTNRSIAFELFHAKSRSLNALIVWGISFLGGTSTWLAALVFEKMCFRPAMMEKPLDEQPMNV